MLCNNYYMPGTFLRILHADSHSAKNSLRIINPIIQMRMFKQIVHGQISDKGRAGTLLISKSYKIVGYKSLEQCLGLMVGI